MLLCCTARQKTSVGTICDNRVVNWTDQFCFFFFFSFAANQQTRRCRRIQMSDEVMSLSRCSDSAALSFEYVSSPLLWCFRIFYFDGFFLTFKAFMCCNFPVCPSVPETLNLWGHIRSQVRSSGTGLHSVSTSQKKEHFPKRWPHSKRFTTPESRFWCNMSPLVLSWWRQAVWNVSGDAPAALWRV